MVFRNCQFGANDNEINAISADVFDACSNATNKEENATTARPCIASSNSYLVTAGSSRNRGSTKMTLVSGMVMETVRVPVLLSLISHGRVLVSLDATDLLHG